MSKDQFPLIEMLEYELRFAVGFLAVTFTLYCLISLFFHTATNGLILFCAIFTGITALIWAAARLILTVSEAQK